MEFIPKALVVGILTATPPGGLDRDKLNRVWSDLSSRQEYRQFNVAAEGATFVGGSPDDALVIQPPLVQVRSTARLGVKNAADEAQVAIKAVARHMGWSQFFNLGIKHIYNVAVPDGDARAFVGANLLGGGGEQESVGAMERGEPLWAGLKYGAAAPDGSVYTIAIEPLLADNKYLFIDLDAQYPGPADPDRLTDRAEEGHDYAEHSIRQYLERASGL